MTRRSGITLVEALVALFIAALGMIALLTLFPLGALQMRQALKDSRCSQSAQEADGLLRWYWAKYETNPTANTAILAALDKGDSLPTAQHLLATDRGPSYPVFVDPMGRVINWPSDPNQPFRMAGMQTFARLTPMMMPTDRTDDAKIMRFTMLQDDITFSDDKTGAPATGTQVQRGGRYNWAWVLQRPDNSRRGLINMTVVVFDRRPAFFADASTEVLCPNTQFSVGGNTTTVAVPYTVGNKPPIEKGRWILDATLNANGNAATPLRHANFYRVSSVTDDAASNLLLLELETPVRRSDGGTAAYTGTLVVLFGIAEVFERPVLVTGDQP